MIMLGADEEQLYGLRTTGDVAATFTRTYRDGDLLAFSDGTVIRARWQPVGGYGLWRLTPVVTPSPVRFEVLPELADPSDGDRAHLDAVVTWVVALDQSAGDRYPDAPPAPGATPADPPDRLGVTDGPWRVEQVMRGVDEGDEPFVFVRDVATLREAMTALAQFACWAGSLAGTVLGADEHVAAFWRRSTNKLIRVTAQARWVDECHTEDFRAGR